ncbi:ATP-binding protein [Limnoglobus roseus]|uniref:ATP-binding protein n=1 Tax=Limnoglobus roseus TaxID=2598579 RepID=A0A5C1ARR2_9BACT|nr:ATP-binding protein [Limnoglobus roseus]QEL20402.1 ATP-binding protein [Limnoglobus roseus]
MPSTSVKVAETLPTELAEVRRVQSDIKDALQANGFGERDMFHIELAMEEALVNAMKHGNQLDTDKAVQLHYTVTPEQFDVRIEDEGGGFNPDDVPDPTVPENLERACGRGLYMIRCFMTEVRYIGKGNVVAMTKKKSPPDEE